MSDNTSDTEWQEAALSAHEQHERAEQRITALEAEIERLQALNVMLQEMNDNQKKLIERLDDERRKLEAERN